MAICDPGWFSASSHPWSRVVYVRSIVQWVPPRWGIREPLYGAVSASSFIRMFTTRSQIYFLVDLIIFFFPLEVQMWERILYRSEATLDVVIGATSDQKFQIGILCWWTWRAVKELDLLDQSILINPTASSSAVNLWLFALVVVRSVIPARRRCNVVLVSVHYIGVLYRVRSWLALSE